MSRITWSAGAIAALLTISAVATATTVASAKDDDKSTKPFTMAVIGDIPYGDAQIAAFPGRIDDLNDAPDVQMVTHLGDIKSGSSKCTDEYFQMIKTQFDRLEDPLVYTPGDNEWTDCHRANNGGYDPLERLAAVRKTFLPVPNRTMGLHPVTVESQAALGFPENVTFTRGGVVFAVPHIVGSNDSLVSWTGKTAPTPEQTVEVLSRTSADIQLLHDAFSRARWEKAKTVVIITQADMFDRTFATPVYTDWYGFEPIVQAIAREASSFDGSVLLVNGDSHLRNDDNPLAAGSRWLPIYHLAAPVSNLRRWAIEGSTDDHEWTKLTVAKGKVTELKTVPFEN